MEKSLKQKSRVKRSKKVQSNLKKKTKRENFKPPGKLTINELKTYTITLQSNLAMALRQGDNLSVIRLIKKIPRDKNCIAWAVYRTISSTGARSAGYNDMPKPRTQAGYDQLIHKVWNVVKYPHSYKATPLKRIYIPKPKGGLRPLSVPTYLDRAVQHLYLLILDVFQEETADPNSFGFRKFRSPGWASKAVTLTLWQRKTQGPPAFAVELDIAKCFDMISHDFIIQNIANVKFNNNSYQVIPEPIIKAWLKQGFVDAYGTLSPKHTINPTSAGVPQGGPISPTIMNMVLNGIENVVRQTISNTETKVKTKTPTPALVNPEDKLLWLYHNKPFLCTFGCSEPAQINQILKSTGLWTITYKVSLATHLLSQAGKSRAGWSYQKLAGTNNPSEIAKTVQNYNYARIIRFADDCIVFVDNEEMVHIIILRITNFLEPRGLTLNKEKTLIKNLSKEEFSFVGFAFKYKKGTVYNFPPKLKVQNLLKKLKTIFTSKEAPFHTFRKANSILNGWLNFYRVANSSNCYSYLKFRLFHLVYRYLFKYHLGDKRFVTGKRKRPSLKQVSQYIWERYRRTLPNSRQKWWCIPSDSNKTTGRYSGKHYFLACPAKVTVATPSIITSKNAYHPSDRAALLEKAIKWRWGLKSQILERSKGKCKNCNCDLLDDDSISYQIHHIKPLAYGGDNSANNLIPLCVPCHKLVTKAQMSNDQNSLLDFYTRNIISMDLINPM